MNRLEKKCFVGSAAMHGLLAVIFLFGSAFFTSKKKEDSLPPITFTPDTVVDQMLYGGGNPQVQPQPLPLPAPKPIVPEVKPLPVPVAPQPLPKVVKPPEPVKPKEAAKPKEEVEPKHVGKEPGLTKTSKNKQTNNIADHISLTVVKRSKVDQAALKAEKEAREQAEADARAYAQYQKQVANAARAVGQISSKLGSQLSANTVSVEAPGPGGKAFANYGQWVQSVYDMTWVSDDVEDDGSIVKAKVTIAREGGIISARIISPSSNRALDKSVQRVLDEVKTIGKSFPDGAKEDQRVFTINFSLKGKRHLG